MEMATLWVNRFQVIESLVRCTELLGGGSDGLVAAVAATVFPAGDSRVVLDVEQAVAGNGGAVSIAGHGLENWFRVVERLIRCTERWFGIDPPFGLVGGGEVTQESTSRPQRLQGGKELQLAGIECLFEIFEEQSPEQTAQHPNRQEEIGAAGDPTRAV